MPVRPVVWLAAAASLLAANNPGLYLPGDVQPRHYALQLIIDPAKPTYTGRVRIEIANASPASALWLDGSGLDVKRARLDGRPVRVLRTGPSLLRVAGEREVRPGTHLLDLRFSARFTDAPVGAYRRRSGEDWYVYTTFTAIEARRAFPCFDEPRFKTPWDVAIRAPRDLVAVSNSREISARPAGRRWTVHRFATTAPLPTEVVAFAVGPFEIAEGRPAGAKHVPVRVLTPRGRGKDGQLAADTSDEILTRLEAYTDIPYPWDKLDHVALLDHAFGAVENPGLITYNIHVLLGAPALANGRRRTAMRSTMAHELAHQWFGNLVTQRDWDDVWLSEGFATWLGTKVMDADAPPERRGVAQALATRRMMSRDGGAAARPVRKPMRSPEDMKDVYSGTVYQKGAAVLAILENWIGEGPFRSSVRRYLHDHANGSATTFDLAQAIRSETGIDVLPVFSSYLDQTGVPQVEMSADCPPALRVAGNSRLPVCVAAPDKRECIVAPGATRGVACRAAWLYGDAGGTGYYRVRSPWPLPSMDVLSPAERMTLILDRLGAAGL